MSPRRVIGIDAGGTKLVGGVVDEGLGVRDRVHRLWRGGDRGKAVELVPRDLVEDIFILGDADAQGARLERYVEGGISTPVILHVPIVAPGSPVSADTFVQLVQSLAPKR